MTILRDYPDAVLAFHIRLGARYRHLQEWLDGAADGHREKDHVIFNTLAGAEAFAAEHGERIITTIARSPDDDRETVRTIQDVDRGEIIEMVAADAKRRAEGLL